MDVILLIARLALAAVFAVAGVAKLLDLAGSRRAMQGFGLPSALAAPAGVALPVAELLVAAALIPRATAWWGGAGAAILLATFIAGIAVNLRRGRTPDCHCFGQIHSEPVGPATLIRNGALAIVALLIVGFGWGDPGPSAVTWLGELSTVEQVMTLVLVIAAVAVAIVGWLTVQLLTQNGRLLQRLDELDAARAGAAPKAPTAEAPNGLPVGTPAPAFELNDLAGASVSLDALRAVGKPILAIFSSPGCGPCRTLLPDIARWQRDHSDTFTIALIASGTAEDNRSKTSNIEIERVLLDARHEVASSYESNRTPAAVVIRPDGTIGSPLIGGVEAIRHLMSQASAPAPPAVGSPTPAFTLHDLDGRQVTTAEFSGRGLALLFWRPGCGFCQRMVPELRAWLANRAEDDPAVVLISSESVEANRAMGIDAPILLDEGFTTGRAFGARGTPSAVVIAADGTLASPVTVGAPAIMQLLGATAESALQDAPR